MSLRSPRFPLIQWFCITAIVFAGGRTEGATPKPNVLFLCVDDMKDWVNCLGGYEGKVHTPNIDRLSERGVLFTNAHCVSPKCAPSRAAILTGMRPSTTGLYDNGHWWLPNLPNVVTIPQHFRNHGYRVAGAGKIFHHTAGNHPPNQWDDFRRLTFQEDPWFRGVKLNYPWSKHTPYPAGFPFSGVKKLGHENDWGPLPIEDHQYDDAVTTDFTVDFLSQRTGDSDTPFFLACGLFRPHLPWYVPQKYFDKYPLDEIVLPHVLDGDLDDLPAAGLKLAKDRRGDFETIRKADKWKHAIRAYLASITCADDRLGQVLDALDKRPDADNTIVVLWSDHGWHLGEKQHWHKSTLWEESTRVPFIVCAPGYHPGTCSRPVSLLDLYPTLNKLAGLDAIESHDGHSLVPLLRNPTVDWDRPAVIEYRRGNAAVRSDRYRFIRYHDGGEELYDHETDPREWKNLAASPEHAAVRKELAGWIAKDWAPSAPTKGAFRFDYKAFTWTNKKSGKVTRGKD
jgi:choline-sulfatase